MLILYRVRDISPMKEFISWALTNWSIITIIGICALGATGLVIKHNFGKKLEIDIHKSKSKSISSYRDDKYSFEIEVQSKSVEIVSGSEYPS